MPSVFAENSRPRARQAENRSASRIVDRARTGRRRVRLVAHLVRDTADPRGGERRRPSRMRTRSFLFAALLLPALATTAHAERRSSKDNTLTAEDRAQFRAMGLGTADAAVVVTRRIPITDRERQLARLRTLTRSVDGFAPSGACDGITSEGEGRGLCTGSVDGPLGRVSARMPVAARLSQAESGAVRLTIRNHRPLEIKPLFSWTQVVPPGRLALDIDMVPEGATWVVRARVAVDMTDYEGSASKITDAMLKLEAWLAADLSR